MSKVASTASAANVSATREALTKSDATPPRTVLSGRRDLWRILATPLGLATSSAAIVRSMKKADSQAVPPVKLSAATAFVVHLGETAANARCIFGRVEHVASGSSTSFASVAELLRFMRRTLGPSATTTV